MRRCEETIQLGHQLRGLKSALSSFPDREARELVEALAEASRLLEDLPKSEQPLSVLKQYEASADYTMALITSIRAQEALGRRDSRFRAVA